MLDTVSAFAPQGRFTIEGDSAGPLRDLAFAVKDVIDVRGHPTGAGNPDWLWTHAVPDAHASCIQRLLDQGATLVGKTMTDEICCSMSGINPHYGTPLNTASPERVCGGSSSGSAAVVAAGLVDFALGTDTSGSVRLPASYCGIYGLRPTFGAIPTEGVMPLAPSCDTVGVMAREIEVLRRVVELLVEPDRTASRARRPHLLVAVDAFGFADPDVQQGLIPVLRSLTGRVASVRGINLFEDDLVGWLRAHLAIVEHEFHAVHQPWIDRVKPRFGPDVGARMEDNAPVDPARLSVSNDVRAFVRARLAELLEGDTLLCMPTVHSIAPLRTAPQDELTSTEVRSIALGCVAALSGVPQLSCPWTTASGAPVGVSLLAAAHRDRWLIERAAACAM